MTRRQTNDPDDRVTAGRRQVAAFERDSAAPVATQSVTAFMHHIKFRYPVRIHRMNSDARWLRRKARKFGANPDDVMRSLS